ncbi:MAG: cofactor-independent phosphoglycerate mutase [Desulfovibrionaceae bacterium]
MSPSDRKVLFLIADGFGDWPLDELDGKTPIEAAYTPHMDELARTGVVGRCQTIPQGMAPGSDTANMSLLGFDPARYHTGRGPIEAAAQGLTFDPDDLIWRMNLVNLTGLASDGTMLDYSSSHITTAQSTPLIELLQKELGDDTYTFIPGVQYRHLLVQKGGKHTPDAGLFINPPHDITNKPIAPDLEAFASSPALNTLLHKAVALLSGSQNTTKARSIWPWGQGGPLMLPDFAETFGLKGAVISAVDLIKGLGLASGMDVLNVDGVTGLLDTNYEGKVAAALNFLEQGNFVFVHVEAPDECGHSGIASDKVEAMARFDSRVVGPLRKALAGRDIAYVVACDHYTPIVERTHTTDAVPFLLNYPDCRPSNLAAFSERLADSTGLRIDKGHDLLPWTLRQMGLAQ